MMKNVIILGPGRTGSSILAGMIAHNRFYINMESIQSRDGYPDGDYENPELVALNKDIFFESGYGHHKIKFDRSVDIESMEKLGRTGDIEKYKNFVAKCDQNSPWLWKDPRLCYTIFFWKDMLDVNDVDIIFITRDPYQIFKSYMKYQVFFTKQDVYRKYDEQVGAVENFLRNTQMDVLRVDYEELKDIPVLVEKLNGHLNTNIKMEDYEAIYRSNFKKQEKPLKFWFRYGIGVTKLKIDRTIKGWRASL